MKMLIAVDGSAASMAAVRFAVGLAAALPELAITLLHVRQSHVSPVAGLAQGLYESPLEQQVEALQREVLRDAGAVVEAAGLQAETRVESGQPGPAICRVAAEGSFDLVVVGSHGHGDLRSLLLGRVSTDVVQGASCSVLVVR